MTSSSARKHAGPGPATDRPPIPEPTFAERARTLAYLGRMGSLSTLSRKQPGFPFGSVMPYRLDDHGRPIFLISTMAMHTQNLQADPHASLLVTQQDTEGEPDRFHCPASWGNGDWERAGRTRHSQFELPPRSSLRAHELRRDPLRPLGKRAFRA